MTFFTRDKKPTIWNVAALSAVAVIAVTVLAALPGSLRVRHAGHGIFQAASV